MSKDAVKHHLHTIRDKLTGVGLSILDALASPAEDIHRFLNAIFAAQSGTYWLILIMGVTLLWLGVDFTSGDTGATSPVLISSGTSILAIYLANLLRKLTTSIPRKEWVQKVGACNDELVSHLLELSGRSGNFYSSRSYQRELKATIVQEVPTTLANIRKLEILIRKRDIGFFVDLKAHDLKHIMDYMAVVSKNIGGVSRNYGHPIANREFNRDFAKLKLKLQEAIDVLRSLEGKTLVPVHITRKRLRLFGQDKECEKNLDQIKTEVYVRSKHLVKLQAKADVFWVTVQILEYLRALINLISVYGYSNNAAISTLKSRFLYAVDRCRRIDKVK